MIHDITVPTSTPIKNSNGTFDVSSVQSYMVIDGEVSQCSSIARHNLHQLTQLPVNDEVSFDNTTICMGDAISLIQQYRTNPWQFIKSTPDELPHLLTRLGGTVADVYGYRYNPEVSDTTTTSYYNQ